MSRIGDKPIAVPGGVEVALNGRSLTIKGPKGELSWETPDVVDVAVDAGAITVTRNSEKKFAQAMHGTTRSLIANMIEGVHTGFRRELEIQGVGFRAQVQGQKLVIQSGFSHPITLVAPEGVKVESPSDTLIVVTGPDKQAVGQFSSKVRSSYPAEPYKGKGIRYRNEQIRRKAGKTVA